VPRGEISPDAILGKTVGVLGYGSQGAAQAMNLRDAGVRVLIGQRDAHESRGAFRAVADGWAIHSLEHVAAHSDVLLVALPDRSHGEVLGRLAPLCRPDTMWVFIHGFSVHYGLVTIPENITAALIAPKGVGPEVRGIVTEGGGVPSLLAAPMHPAKTNRALAISYAAAAFNAHKSTIFETTFGDESETDLFGEQAVLCGGLPALIAAAFDTLVEAGYPAELAYFECCHEVKLIADLMIQVGPEGLSDWISDTADYGGLTRGSRLVTDETREALREMLGQVRRGDFAKEYMAEMSGGMDALKKLRAERKGSLLAKEGERVRGMLGLGKKA